jgi:hypothetical protein
MDGKSLEKRGGKRAQRFGRFQALKPLEQAESFCRSLRRVAVGIAW